MTDHKNGVLSSLVDDSGQSVKALLSILDALPELAFILSYDGDYIEIFGGDDSLLMKDSKALIGKTVFDVLPADKAEFVISQIRQSINTNANVSVEYELEVIKGIRLFKASIAPMHGLNYPKQSVIWFARDITLEKQEQNRLLYLAFNDPLTDLPNRRLLETRLEEENFRCLRHGQFSALLFIDLDDFKQINDTNGHSFGDKVLKETSKRLKKAIRRDDFACRISGDEFVVILSFIAANKKDARTNALEAASTFLLNLKEPMLFGKQQVNITASIGLSFLPTPKAKPKIIINRADRAMYKAKENGKSCVFISEEVTRTSHSERNKKKQKK